MDFQVLPTIIGKNALQKTSPSCLDILTDLTLGLYKTKAPPFPPPPQKRRINSNMSLFTAQLKMYRDSQTMTNFYMYIISYISLFYVHIWSLFIFSPVASTSFDTPGCFHIFLLHALLPRIPIYFLIYLCPN